MNTQDSRRTITVAETAHRRCEELKGEMESWSQFLDRAADALESPGGSGEHSLNTLTEDHIDDIAARTAKKTVEEMRTELR